MGIVMQWIIWLKKASRRIEERWRATSNVAYLNLSFVRKYRSYLRKGYKQAEVCVEYSDNRMLVYISVFWDISGRIFGYSDIRLSFTRILALGSAVNSEIVLGYFRILSDTRKPIILRERRIFSDIKSRTRAGL